MTDFNPRFETAEAIDVEHVRSLISQRAEAVRVLNGIDADECLIVGGGLVGSDELEILKGDPGFDVGRAAVVHAIHALNDELSEAGVTHDFADTETGVAEEDAREGVGQDSDADEGDDDDNSEFEDAGESVAAREEVGQ